jgi:hypothetical protein
VRCGDDPNIPIVGGVRIGLGTITGKRKGLAVRRPGRLGVVIVAGSHLGERPGGDFENVKVGAATIEVADGVFLENQAINDPGALSLGFFGGGVFIIAVIVFGLFGDGFKFLGRGITEDEHQASANRRPSEVVDTLSRFSEALGFTAHAIQHINLGLFLFAFGILALGEEREEFPVGRPARMLSGRAFRGERDGFAAGGRHHPDASFGFVVLEERGGDGVGHELAVGRDLRVVHFAKLEEVVDGDEARCGGLLGAGQGTGQPQNKREHSKA